MKKEDLVIFSTARVVYDNYKTKFDNAKAKKEQRFKELNTNYKPGSPMFIIEREKITPEYEKEVETAREECRNHFMNELENIKAKERALAAIVTGGMKDILNTLKCLEDCPVSLDEYATLTNCMGDKYYWVDRFFEHIAEKNGIQNTGVQPSLTTKLQILDRLAAEVNEFLDKYNGDDKSFIVTSSDSHIFKMEDEYTNGYKHVYMNGKEQAKRLISEALNKGDSLERACYLVNVIRTSAPELQTDILKELADRDRTALHDPTMNFAGVTDVLENFKKTEYEGIKQAERIIEKIKSTDLEHEKETIAFHNLDNRYFIDMVKKSDDKNLQALVKEMQEVKEAGEARERREKAANGANKGE